MIKHQLVIGFALLVGVAIGYFAAPTNVPSEGPVEDDAYRAQPTIADEGEGAALAALRARVKELEAQLVGKREEDVVLVSNAVDRLRGERRFGGERSRNPQEWMENLKKTNPERFAQMTNTFMRMRAERLNLQQHKLDYLSSIETSHMSVSARQTHEKLQELIVRREELEEDMIAHPDMSWEDRAPSMRQMREIDEEIRHLNGEERRNLFAETAHALGLDGDDAAALTETLQEIIDATESGPWGRMPEGGRGPRGGGRGR